MLVSPSTLAILNALRHILLEERNKHRLTQIELAEKSGLTRQCISNIESGQGSPTISSLTRLAYGLNIPATDFMSLVVCKARSYGVEE